MLRVRNCRFIIIIIIIIIIKDAEHHTQLYSPTEWQIYKIYKDKYKQPA